LAERWRAGIYAPESTLRTYAECRRRAEALLFEGKRVIVDASFADEALRLAFMQMGRALCVPVLWLVCRASVERVRQRLAARTGDASDADWTVYEEAQQRFSPPAQKSAAVLAEIDTDQGEANALEQALAKLRERNLG
jgi:uncharacterized protein